MDEPTRKKALLVMESETKCPRCNGLTTWVARNLYCNSCGAHIAIDLTEATVSGREFKRTHQGKTSTKKRIYESPMATQAPGPKVPVREYLGGIRP